MLQSTESAYPTHDEATFAIGWRRLWVAPQNQRVKNFWAAPGLR